VIPQTTVLASSLLVFESRDVSALFEVITVLRRQMYSAPALCILMILSETLSAALEGSDLPPDYSFLLGPFLIFSLQENAFWSPCL
jgi:hypothetical protein